jgi:hypothetical protein
MNKQEREQLAYDAEFAKDMVDSEKASEDDIAASKRDQFCTVLSNELTSAIAAKRQIVEPKLTQAALLYNGVVGLNGRESVEEGFDMPEVKSRIYKNISRQITNDGYKQLGDLLFPTDDKNYGMREVSIAPPPQRLLEEPAVDSKGEPLVDAEDNPLTNKQAHQRRVQKIRTKVERMTKRIEYGLTDSSYAVKGRKVLRHAAIYGTGILKAPIPKSDKGQIWAKRKSGAWDLKTNKGVSFELQVVSPLDFYPDLSAGTIEQCEYIWERSYISPSMLEEAAKKHGWDEMEVKYLLQQKPQFTAHDDYARLTLREQSANTLVQSNRYEVYERHGRIKREYLENLGVKLPEKGMYFDAVVWMCEKRVLKVALTPFKKHSHLYSVFCWEEQEENIFGEGIPLLMEHCQRTYNTAWCICLDNAGLSAMPQIVIDKDAIQPADGSGDYSLRGGKPWLRKGDTYSNENLGPAFEIHEIKQDIQSLFTLMDKAEEAAYKLTGVTFVDRQNAHPDNSPVTLGATNIYQNNSTISRRGLARQWDDNITLPTITRIYDYLMQYDDDDEIKGLMVVEPRGSTVLLSKELAASNLLQLWQMSGGGQHPEIRSAALLRNIAVSMQFPEDKFVLTEDELAQIAEQQANQPDPQAEIENRKIEIEEAKIELDQQRLQMDQEKFSIEMQFKQQLEQAKIELKQFELAHKDKALDVDSQVRLAELTERVASSERSLEMAEKNKRDIEAAKLAVKRATDTGDASIRQSEQQLRERETSLKEAELDYKIRTGNTGI